MDKGIIYFFILMPIVYELIKNICYIVFENFSYCDKPVRAHLIFISISLSIDYIIEFIFLKTMKNIVGISLFSTDFPSELSVFIDFRFFSIAFIVVHILGLIVFSEIFDNDIPYAHIIFLIIFFVIFLFIEKDIVTDKFNEFKFNKTDYSLTEEYSIELHSLSDGHTTSGDLSGGRFYIKGIIEDNYNIYYSFVNEKGSLVIRSIPYNENRVDIYEEKDCSNPRIDFYKYSKTYKDLYDEYYEYDIYIPVGTMDGISINME